MAGVAGLYRRQSANARHFALESAWSGSKFPIADKANVPARRLSIHKDRMRELKDGGTWQRRNERIAEISPQPLLHLGGDFRPRKKSDLRAGMVLRGA